MSDRPSARLRVLVSGALALAVGAGGLATQPAASVAATGTGRTPVVSTLGDPVPGLADLDVRGTVLPTALQRRAARTLNADVRWNAYGTPASVYARSGSLGRATSSDPVTAARSWLRDHAALLGLSRAQVGGLELVNDQRFAGSSARAVLLRQRFGRLSPAIDGMVTVGVAHGQVVYLSSSLARVTRTPAAARLTPQQGWLAAAASIGRSVSASDLGAANVLHGWTRFSVPGFAQQQLARVRAFAFPDGRVVPVIEADVVDAEGGSALAYTVLVDAVTGKVLFRQNQVHSSNDAFQFSGSIGPDGCGPKHPFETTDASTRQITVTAATTPNVDIVLRLLDAKGAPLSSSDNATSPEVLTYSPGTTIPKGVYNVQVCLFDDPTVPYVGPGNYVGTIATSDSGAATPSAPFPPRWAHFLANPSLDWSADKAPGNRRTGCWVTENGGSDVKGCDTPPGALENLAASGPWDTDPRTHLPTFTTIGNAAVTHEAWASPLTPGGAAQAPYAPDRSYTPAFKDTWNNSQCDPTNLVPGGNDIDASVTNLFVAHNRMHDFAYYLGFTERNYNLQQSNLGRNPDPSRENDAEIGNVQAGALTGGQPSELGRDNANQIALQDGVPGITNQYLFQPIAGAFYSPCTDGSFDMSVVGHEYTHAISNRMIGGPDEGITSAQGGAMGESWGDLTASEFELSHGYANGTDPWVVGAYVTGNKAVGIRDYALDHNPLNYSDLGFDSPGPEVHADGEIWNGTQYSVRQALVRKWNKRFPYTDTTLQRRCADGTATSSPLPSTRCPGNRRWIQLMFDAFLLQQGATSMLDARDAMLAADQMRYHGANQKALWLAFARRGMGVDARTPNADSDQPRAGFRSPLTAPATVTFRPRVGGHVARGLVYIGRWEARATPVADTLKGTKLGATVKLSPGTYDVLFAGPGTGLTRSRLTVRAGQKLTRTWRLRPNLASAADGAKVVAASPGSLNAGDLIDDTEATSWAGVNTDQSVDVAHPWVIVDLAGGRHELRSARVSAMLHPAPSSSSGLPLASDPDSGARFTALRRFAIETCVQTAKQRCDAHGRWKRVYTSPADAFPGVRPRPVAPNLALRTFRFPASVATHVRFVALENQCTGYSGYAGEQDADPTNDTDCKAASDMDLSVRAAELELFD